MSFYIKLELIRDRRHSFARFRSFDLVRYGDCGNVLLPQFTRYSLVIFHP